jgi:hypothetical protein
VAVLAGFLGCMAASHRVHVGPVKALAVVHVGCRACTRIRYLFSSDAEMHMQAHLNTRTQHTICICIASFRTKQARLNTLNLSINRETRDLLSAYLTYAYTRKIWSRSPFWGCWNDMVGLLNTPHMNTRRKTHLESFFLVTMNHAGRPVWTHAHTHIH